MVGFSLRALPTMTAAFYLLAALLVILFVIDASWLMGAMKIKVSRLLPGRFAQGRDAEVVILVKNPTNMTLNISVFDGVPQEAKCDQLPWQGKVLAGNLVEIRYDAAIWRRGWATFTETFLEVRGPLKLWSRIVREGDTEKIRVYPDYEPVLQLSLLSMDNNPEQMGILKKNRSGLSKEFHQLRDYHQGDMLSQIDWKASSKKQSLISKDYHEQRDQTIIIAIDCGRRMRAMDGESSQFDHCLNAMLLLAYIALKQGDNVGIMAYGGREHFLPPVKGLNAMTTILNHLFDYQTSSSPSDYNEAVERIMIHQNRRAMVVFLSNFRGEDVEELIEPMKKLRQKHIVSLGNLRELEVDKISEAEVTTFEEALRLAGIQEYLDGRKSTMDQLMQLNIASVDVNAIELPVALANQYLLQREMV